jgi:drug/metabolite transporter (DMT)-like permease
MASSLETIAPPGRSEISDRPGVSMTDALLVVTMLLWGINYTVVKYGTQRLDPLAYNVARIVLGTLAFLVIVRVRPGRPIARRDLWALLGLGVLGNGVYQVMFVEGVARTRAGTAALILSASPALVALIGRSLGVERIHARNTAGIILSMIGIALVISGTALHGAERATLFGDLLAFAGAACWAIYTVLLKPYTHRVSLYDLSLLTLLGGAVPLVLVSTPALIATPWTALPPLTWGAVVYSGIGSLVVGYVFWYRGVRVLGPTRTAIYSNLQPVIALLVSWVVLREVPTAWQWVGAATIIGGVILTRT